MKETAQLLIQYLLPQHIVSRLAGIVAHCPIGWLKNFLIRKFVAHYHVNMGEALEENPLNYATFNDFFTRVLKPQARPIAAEAKEIVSPVDGQISQIGKIEKNILLQAKGKNYKLETLLGTAELAKMFYDGNFATIYLSPKDYHRVHMPFTGKVRQVIYVPGTLFTVNAFAAKNIKGVFGRNERVIVIFDTPIGPMALILVGAMIVGSVATKWNGIIMPSSGDNATKMWNYTEQSIVLQHGEEMGYFQLGSTVILLFPPNTMQWLENKKVDEIVQMGQVIAHVQ